MIESQKEFQEKSPKVREECVEQSGMNLRKNLKKLGKFNEEIPEGNPESIPVAISKGILEIQKESWRNL